MLRHLLKGRQLCGTSLKVQDVLVCNKSSAANLKGMVVAPLTPFDTNGDVNYDVFKDCMRYYEKSHFNGLFVNGTLGEGMALSCQERMKTAEKWKDVSGKLYIILHIGTGNIEETKQLARHAEDLGVDAIAALPPTYQKPTNEEQLVDYLEKVAESAPNTPLLYYEYNITTGVNLNMPRFLQLAEKRLPTLYGLKHTTADLNSALNCCMVCDRKYKIFYGSETLYLSSLCLGLPDIITSPYMGKFFYNIKASFDKGDMKAARELQEKALSLINIQVKHGGGIRCAKGLFELASDIQIGAPRLPLHGMSEDAKEKMRQDLENGGYWTNETFTEQEFDNCVIRY